MEKVEGIEARNTLFLPILLRSCNMKGKKEYMCLR